MCVLSIKVTIRKKSGNLLKAPCKKQQKNNKKNWKTENGRNIYGYFELLRLHTWRTGHGNEMLCTDLRPRQTCHSKDGGSAYSIGVGELGWQYGIGLKSHGTDTDYAPEESDLRTAWQLFPRDDDQTCYSKDGGSDTFRWPVMGRYWVGDWTII